MIQATICFESMTATQVGHMLFKEYLNINHFSCINEYNQ